MLILTRRPSESIAIGEGIVVTVVAVAGNQVRLGITAPRHVRVLREEIYRAIQAENKAAADVAGVNAGLGDVLKQLHERRREEIGD